MDDYLTKPFEPKELLFRIKALLLRRYIMLNSEENPPDSIASNGVKVAS